LNHAANFARPWSSGVEGAKPTARGKRLGVRAGGFHVARLHRLHLDLRLLAEHALQRRDVIQELHRPAVADVVDRIRRGPVEDPERAFDDVVDVGEVALHVAVVEDLDRLAFHDGMREQHRRHVGPPPRVRRP